MLFCWKQLAMICRLYTEKEVEDVNISNQSVGKQKNNNDENKKARIGRLPTKFDVGLIFDFIKTVLHIDFFDEAIIITVYHILYMIMNSL